MGIALMAILGIAAAFALVRFGPLARKAADNAGPDEGMHKKRIGDGLKRLEAMKRRYAIMTPALLEETPDADLIEAVLSNLWAKMRPDMSDALAVMGAQSQPRQHIFALYAVTGGVKQAGFDALRQSPDAALLPVALEGLSQLKMPQTEAILREAMEAEEADGYRAPYTDAFDGEGGKENMVRYIRKEAAAFCDMP